MKLPNNFFKNTINTRSIILGTAFLFGTILAIFQLVKISFFQKNHYDKMFEKKWTQIGHFEGERGRIIGDSGHVFALNSMEYDIYFDPTCANRKNLFYKSIDSLTLLINRDIYRLPHSQYPSLKKKLISELKKESQYVLIQKSVNSNQLQKIKKFPIFREKNGGLIIKKITKRSKPFENCASRLVGNFNEYKIPTSGLEESYNAVLRPESKEIRIGNRSGLSSENLSEHSLKSGSDLHITLNSTVQGLLHRSLYKSLISHNAERAFGIVMEVETGAIKAMSNLHMISPNQVVEDLNYCVAQNYEPGSTFKAASYLAAMEEADLELYDTVNINGGIAKFGSMTIKDSDHERIVKTKNNISLLESFATSSNVGTAKMVTRAFPGNAGAKKFIHYLEKFGLTERTKVDLNGEPSPLIKSPDLNQSLKWDDNSSLAMMSTGYEIEFTPLQITSFFNAIANKGEYVKPRFASHITDKDGNLEKAFATEVVKRRIASKKSLEKLNTMLREVVVSGTAKSRGTAMYDFSGKTGTTQIRNENGIGNIAGSQKYRSSFVGFFPSENPKYTIFVLVENPKSGSYYGSEIALPVFREVADAISNIFVNTVPLKKEKNASIASISKSPRWDAGLKTEMQFLLNYFNMNFKTTGSSNWAYINSKNDTILLSDRGSNLSLIPNVQGMGIRDAIYLLENRGIQVRFNGRGKVKRQSVQPGSKLVKGSLIHLDLG
jgi:cell division protein FtsI (penicillin-binding protein 3)